MQFKNTDTLRRYWPGIQVADGSTLDLAPGETAELDLADDFEDAYLKPVAKPKPKKETKAEKEAAAKAETNAAPATVAADTTAKE